MSAALAAGLLVAALAACAGSDGGAGPGGSDQTLVFGVPGAPDNFDPAFARDGETLRPARQMFDTLVAYKRGSTELEPGLATRWQPNADFTQWTFTLRRGVTFHDGTPFDAAAVCANFDRWYHLKGAPAQTQAYYYGAVFGGFAENATPAGAAPVYKSCAAPDPGTAVLTLNRAKAAFPAAFGLTSFAISSPTALTRYDADRVEQSGAAFSYGAYATEHPTGTGPFKFESYDRATNVVTLVRNDQYWGDKAKLAKLVFKVIPDENDRKQELKAGTIDGFDFPNAADWETLRTEGDDVLVRPVFNLLYLGINQKNNPALRDLRVRQAIAYATDRPSLVRNQLPEGAMVASQFVPNTVDGYAPDLQPPPYDPERARQLLAAAGASDLTVDFAYPTDVTRPYMPNPTTIFTALAGDLRAVGITVNPVPMSWNGGYLDAVATNGTPDLHLLGWTGDYNDPGNFIGTFFGTANPEFGLDQQHDRALFNEVAAADAVVDPVGHSAAYEQVNRDLMEKYLPAVPISSSPPALVVRENITGLVPSPLTDERFVTVTKS